MDKLNSGATNMLTGSVKSVEQLTGLAKEIYEKLNLETTPLNVVLLNGTMGTGKTTLSVLLSERLFNQKINIKNPASYSDIPFRYLCGAEIKADSIRTTIEPFLTSPPTKPYTRKVMILDELDNSSDVAEHQLKSVINKTLGCNIIILITNSKEKLLAPIVDRCSVYNFPSFTLEQARELFKKYNYEISEKDLLELFFIKKGVPRSMLIFYVQNSQTGKFIFPENERPEKLFELLSLITDPKTTIEKDEVKLFYPYKEQKQILQSMISFGLRDNDEVSNLLLLLSTYIQQNNKFELIGILNILSEYNTRIQYSESQLAALKVIMFYEIYKKLNLNNVG